MADKKNKLNMELIPQVKIDNTKIEQEFGELSDSILHSSLAVEEALKKKISQLGDVYDSYMESTISEYEKAVTEAEQKLTKQITALNKKIEKEYKINRAQQLGITPKGKNGNYTPTQLKNIELTSDDLSQLLWVKDKQVSSSKNINNQKKLVEQAQSSLKIIKELKKTIYNLNGNSLNEIEQNLTKIGMSGSKIEGVIKTIKKMGTAIQSYEKIAQNEIGRIEASRPKTPKTRTDIGLDQSGADSKSSALTRTKDLQESLDKATYTAIENKVKRFVEQMKKYSGAKGEKAEISDSQIAEIREAVLEETLAKLNKTRNGELQIPSGRKRGVLDYQEGKPINSNIGVLTARTFDSFVSNGQFIPGSRRVVDERGVESREFYRSIGIADERLRNVKNIGNVGNLFNASISQIQEAYETLENLLKTGNLDKEVEQSISDFMLDIKNSIVESFRNTVSDENGLDLKELFRKYLTGTESDFNKNDYEKLFGETQLRKTGDFYDYLRTRTGSKLVQDTSYDEPDYDKLAYEYKKDGGYTRDNATDFIEALEETVENAPTEAIRNHLMQQILDWQNDPQFQKIINENIKQAIEIAQITLEQTIDSMAKNTKQEVRYDDSVDTISLDSERTSKKGNQYSLGKMLSDESQAIDEDVVDESEIEQISENIQSVVISSKEMKNEILGAIGYLDSYLENVQTNIPEQELQELRTKIQGLRQGIAQLNNDTLGTYYQETQVLREGVTNYSDALSEKTLVGALTKLSDSLDALLANQSILEEEENQKEREALSVEEGRKKVKSGEKFALDEDLQDLEDYYGTEWTKRIQRALDNSSGDMDEAAQKIVAEFINSIYKFYGSQNSSEANAFTTQLVSAVEGTETGMVSLFNRISKLLEDANTIETSIQRRVDALNESAGYEAFTFEGELEAWKKSNPDKVDRYNKSKLARSVFDQSGGLSDIGKSIKSVLDIDDSYINFLKKTFEELNYEFTTIIENTTTDDNGKIKKETERIIQNAQEVVLQGVAARLDKSGTFGNPNALMGKKYYKKAGIMGEEIPEGVALSPQQRTSLYYQAGYTGATYGGSNIDENLINAKKTLENAQKKLTEEATNLSEQEIKKLQAIIEVTQKDIEILEKAKVRRSDDVYDLIPTESVQEIKKKQKKQEKLEKERRERMYEEFDDVNSPVPSLPEDKKTRSRKKKTVVDADTSLTEATIPADVVKLSEITTQDVTINANNATVNSTNSTTQSNGTVEIKAPAQNFTQFEKRVTMDSVEALPVRFNEEDKKFEITNEFDEKGMAKTVHGITNFISLLNGVVGNPETKAKIEDLQRMAKTATGVLTAENTGFSEEEFNQLREQANYTLRGEILHSAFETLAKTGLKTDVLLQDWNSILAQNNNFKKVYEDAIDTLRKFGLDDTFLDLDNGVEAYLNMLKNSGQSLTKIAETAVGLRFKGSEGSIDVATKIDALIAGLQGFGVLDNKIANYTSPQYGLQLAFGKLATKLNAQNNPEFQALLKEQLKSEDGTEIDTNQLAKSMGTSFVAQVQNGVANLIPYDDIAENMIYALLAWSEKIRAGEANPLTKQEKQTYMGVPKTWSAISGLSSNYEETIANEFIMPNTNQQMKMVREYVSLYERILSIQREIEDLENKQLIAQGEENDNLERQITQRKNLIQDLENMMPQLEYTQENVNGISVNRTRMNGFILDSEATEQLELLKQLAEDKDMVKWSDNLTKFFNRSGKFVDKEQLSIMNDYVKQIRIMLNLEKELKELELGIELRTISGSIAENDDAYALMLKRRDELKASLALQNDYLKGYGYEKNSIGTFFGFGNEQVQLTEANAKKLADKLEEIINKSNKNAYDSDIKYYDKRKKAQKDFNEQLVKTNDDYYENLLNLKKLETLQLQNPEGNFYSSEKGKESSQQITYLDNMNKAVQRMEELLRLSQEYNLNMDQATAKINTDTAKYITDLQKENLKQSAIKGTGQNATKTINQYLNNYKQQLKIQEQIYALEKQMETQDGIQLRNSEIYKQSLENQLSTIKSMAPQLNVQEGTINGIKITQEQLNNLLQQQNALDASHASQLNKINAQMKEQRSLVSEIVGGFKQAFRNMTDASIAYEIIGLVRQSITQLIQTTKELDSAMVDLQIASGETRGEIHDMMLGFTELGDELGRTTQDIAEAANDWLRAGYTGEAAAELTRASAQLSTLGMISTSDATSYLISVLKGWKIEAEDVTRVVDKLVSVDMAAALVNPWFLLISRYGAYSCK